MNSSVINIIARFIVLVLLQVAIFDNIHFLGFITPYPYILFILLYPLNVNRNLLLLLSFLLGITLDIFNNSGGVHTTACITLAFMRKSLLKMSFGYSYEYHMFKIPEKFSSELLTYYVSGVLIHHTILITLELLDFKHFVEMSLRILGSSIFTILLFFLLTGWTKSIKR